MMRSHFYLPYQISQLEFPDPTVINPYPEATTIIIGDGYYRLARFLPPGSSIRSIYLGLNSPPAKQVHTLYGALISVKTISPPLFWKQSHSTRRSRQTRLKTRAWHLTLSKSEMNQIFMVIEVRVTRRLGLSRNMWMSEFNTTAYYFPKSWVCLIDGPCLLVTFLRYWMSVNLMAQSSLGHRLRFHHTTLVHSHHKARSLLACWIQILDEK